MSFNTKLLFLDQIKSRHAESPTTFSHVVNVRHSTASGTKVLENIVFRQATPLEIESIKQLMDLSISKSPFDTLVEYDQFYVLESTTHENATSTTLEELSILTNSRLQLGCDVINTCTKVGHMCGWGGDAAKHFHEEVQREWGADWQSPTKEDLADLAVVYGRFKTQPESTRLKAALAQFQQLDSIPKWSPLRFLGYVSIIESLITHKPNPTDPYSSLTRQVREKLQLIAKCAFLPIRYDMLLKDTPKKVWDSVYSYRSKIAHGESSEIEKDTKALRDRPTALKFIEMTTRTVMRQYLDEPELMESLREV